MFLFVILFGLSMDYHVFILSRVKEYYDRGMSTEDAVAEGYQVDRRCRHERGRRDGVRLRRVRPAAVHRHEGDGDRSRRRGPDRRDDRPGVLLPATMKLLGEWNWYLPTWLEWLPTLEHERSLEGSVIDVEPARAAA